MTTLFPPPSPTLPAFRTLLIDGKYHPSAPVHLCVSHLAQSDGKQAVLLHPSRDKFASALKEVNDAWLNEHGGEGSFSQYSRNVQVLYPPTSVHLTFLLNMLHQAQNSDKEDYIRKTTFAATPSLVVLCEPSAYLSGNPDATIASYLSLLSHAISCISYLSEHSNTPVSLVVFDSGLKDLKLPILQPTFREELDKLGEEEAKEKRIEYRPDVTPKTLPMPFLAYKYFELVGTFQDDADNDPSINSSYSFKLVRPESESEELSWKWKERRNPSRQQDGVTYAFTS